MASQEKTSETRASRKILRSIQAASWIDYDAADAKRLLMTSDVIAAVSVVIALFAALGAWRAIEVGKKSTRITNQTQAMIAARNSRAAVVSANRQRWIGAIRDDVAELLSLRRLETYRAIHKQIKGREIADKREEVQTVVDKERVLNRIELRLNLGGRQTEQDHEVLIRELRRSHGFDEDAVKEAARRIFKAEWERLKNEASGDDMSLSSSPAARRKLLSRTAN